ncbi:MAG: class I SAM-dependent methyltransferase [Roseiflexaceae bacterium]
MSVYDSFAAYYEADFGSFAEDVPFYLELAQRTGGPLLELMCGTGRLLLPLAAQGYDLTGVDYAAAMLDMARAKLVAAGLQQRVTLLQADAREATLPAGAFGLAFVALNSFTHMLTVADQLALLAAMRRALRPSGLLAIDLSNPDPTRLLGETGEPRLAGFYELEGRSVVKYVAYRNSPVEQITQVLFRYEERDAAGEETVREVHYPTRWIYRYELEHLLVRAGLTPLAVYGGYDQRPYADGCPQLIMVAKVASDHGNT